MANEIVKAVLKAKRGLNQNKRKAVEDYKKDMSTSQTNGLWEQQKEEFGAFLDANAQKKKPFEFLLDMKANLDKGTLTENMVNAVRKCMEREKQWAKERETEAKAPASKEPKDLPTITLKVKPFIMKDLQIDSRIVTGVVKKETAKAWLVEGYADMLVNASWCMRCGRELTEPASQVTGLGAICASKAGIPYDAAGVLGASKKERAKIRKQFVEKLNNQKFERWIPKSMSEVIVK